LDRCECWEAYDILGVDWFGKPSNTLEPSLWIHSPGSGVKLLLRLGTIVSVVGGMSLFCNQLVSYFIKDNFSLLWFPLLVYLFSLRIQLLYLRLYIEYACLLVNVVHGILCMYFMLWYES